MTSPHGKSPRARRIAGIAALSAGIFAASACNTQQPDAPASTSSTPSSVQSTLLPVRSPLPELTVTAHNGEAVNLRALGGKPTVVYFYPKDDTPGCTIEAQEIRDLWQEIQGAGATVIGVSTDGEASHRAFAEKYELPFLLLPDEGHTLTRAFGVPLKNGKARRVSFVIGRDGKVARVFPDVTPRGHGAELLSALRELPGS